jgi:hypothetical protein
MRSYTGATSMKLKILVVSAVIAAALGLGVALGCQEARSDSQVAADVQAKINGDATVQSRQYTVSANKGLITLGGNVASDGERVAAANDAAQVPGVKTVVNNLQVSPPVVAKQLPPAPGVLSQPAPPEPAPRHREPKAKPMARQAAPQPIAPLPPENTLAANTPPPPPVAPPPPPPPPPKPVEVTIPSGTTLSVRLIDPIDSGRNHPGDSFRATLDSPIRVGDTVAVPAGADVTGRVTDVKDATHFKGSSAVALELTQITVNGKSYDLRTDQFSREGKGRGKNTAEKVGGGALLGALIGGLAGGGKGAAIGAGVGGGAGGGVQGATRGQQVRLTSEQALAFHLSTPLTVTPASGMERNQGRRKLDYSDNGNQQ